MYVRRLIALAFAAALLAPAPASAGGGLFHGKRCCAPAPVVCQQRVKVYVPPVTRTVYEKVMVSPGGCANRRVAAVYGWQQRAYVANPGYERVVTAPPVYGTVQVARQVTPGYVGTVCGSCCGRPCGYQVAVPPSYVTEDRVVQVAPGQTWVERTPPIMGVATERVILEPEHTQQFCQPPVYRAVARQVVVQPGRWYWQPAPGAVGCGRY